MKPIRKRPKAKPSQIIFGVEVVNGGIPQKQQAAIRAKRAKVEAPKGIGLGIEGGKR